MSIDNNEKTPGGMEVFLTEHELYYLLQVMNLDAIAGFEPSEDINTVPIKFIETVLVTRGFLIPSDEDSLTIDENVAAILSVAAKSPMMAQIHHRHGDDEVENHWLHFSSEFTVYHSAAAPQIHRLYAVNDVEGLLTVFVTLLKLPEEGETLENPTSVDITRDTYKKMSETTQQNDEIVLRNLLEEYSLPESVIKALLFPDHQYIFSFLQIDDEPRGTGLMITKSDEQIWCITTVDQLMRVQQVNATDTIQHILSLLEPILEKKGQKSG